MKTSNLLRYAAILPVFVILATGCSKDSLPEPQNNVAKVGKVTAEKNDVTGPTTTDLYGSVQLTALPVDANVSVFIYDGTFYSDEYFADSNGFVRIDNLVPGLYTVLVHPNNPNYSDLQIPNVKVHEVMVNDLGIVKIQ
jgi:hypothetical protein